MTDEETRAAKHELKDLLGELVDSDDDANTTAIERHRSAMVAQDKRQTATSLAKSRELEQLKLTASSLLEELGSLRQQHADDLRARVEAETTVHRQHLENIRQRHDLEAALHRAVELRGLVETLEKEKTHLTELVETRFSMYRKKQRQLREFLFDQELRGRSTIVWAEENNRFAIHVATNAIPSSGKQPSDLGRDVVLLSTLERLARVDLTTDELKAFQTLLNRWAHLFAAHALRSQSPRSIRDTGLSTPTNRKSPSQSHRPWYPPGAARIPQSPVSVRRSRSPSSARSEPTHSRAAIPSTLSNMQVLLANLSSWSETH